MKNKKMIISVILLIISIILITVGLNMERKEKDINKEEDIVETDDTLDEEILDKNVFKANGKYEDDKLILSSFEEQKNIYLLQVYNKQNEVFKTDNFTIEYLDNNKELVFRHILSFEINPKAYYSINTKKELDNMNKIKYIRIVEY